MNELISELQTKTTCELRFDTISQIAYSVDASIYEVRPLGIVIPKTQDDLQQAIKIAFSHKIPITARGAATGITGGCLGSGLIIDLSVYLNHVIEINYDQEYAIVEPGIVQDHLNEILSHHGYVIGPETSTGNRATLGGMLANNAAGARSLHYGKMVDHIAELTLLLADGEKIHLKSLDHSRANQKSLEKSREGNIYKVLLEVINKYKNDIQNSFPKIPRRVSGYNLDELIKPGSLNLCTLIAGSEGTLGVVSQMKIKICKKPVYTALCIIHFDSMSQAMQSVPRLLEFSPLSLEMIDYHIIEAGKAAPKLKGKLGWLEGSPLTVFAAEFDGQDQDEANSKAYNFQKNIQHEGFGYSSKVLTDSKDKNTVWEVRKAGLGLLLSRRSYTRAIAFIEDISIPPPQLASFMDKFLAYVQSVNKEAGIYGHVGSGCMHVRPYMNLRDQADLELIKTMMIKVSDLVLEHGGAMSGEHGDGLIRSWLNEKMFGPKLYQAFCQVKAAFDPWNLMNPGKVVHAPPLETSLATTPQMKIHPITTFQDFSVEGGFELAADLCNGNAQCRKKESLMCPSFHVTNHEYDTTRARAQALKAIVNSKLPIEALTDHEVYKVLDLCIECKGCKTECPSSVDMAKMKAEFLYHYQEKNGYSFRAKLFGYIGNLFQLGSYLPTLTNRLLETKISKTLFDIVGISTHRQFPKLANQKFSTWFKQHNEQPKSQKIVLFNDTYNEYNEPWIGQAAIKVLNALNYQVIVPPWTCCGRPLITKGLLKQARKKADALIEVLYPLTEQNLNIVGLEPSCILTIKDDLPSIVSPHLRQKAKRVSQACLTMDEVLNTYLQKDEYASWIALDQPIKLHGHCHQKALIGTQPTLEVLSKLTSNEATEIKTGCCGMAGSFGYEKEHYDFSLKIAHLHIVPELSRISNDTLIAANGISCRSQIAHTLSKKAYHITEIAAMCLPHSKK